MKTASCRHRFLVAVPDVQNLACKLIIPAPGHGLLGLESPDAVIRVDAFYHGYEECFCAPGLGLVVWPANSSAACLPVHPGTSSFTLALSISLVLSILLVVAMFVAFLVVWGRLRQRVRRAKEPPGDKPHPCRLRCLLSAQLLLSQETLCAGKGEPLTLVLTDCEASTELWEWCVWPAVLRRLAALQGSPHPGRAWQVSGGHDDGSRLARPHHPSRPVQVRALASFSALAALAHNLATSTTRRLTHGEAMVPCRHHGFELQTEGDAFLIAFHEPADALEWALSVQHALYAADWCDHLQRICAWLHTGPDP